MIYVFKILRFWIKFLIFYILHFTFSQDKVYDKVDPKIKVFHFHEINNFHVEIFDNLGHINYTFCHAKIWSQMNKAVVIFIA